MKMGKSIVELAQEIQRRAAGKKDYVADTAALSMDTVYATDTVTGEDATGVELVLRGSQENTAFDIKPLAHGQLADFTGIPKAYYDRMMADAPVLLAVSVNTWLNAKPGKRMVRTLDGSVRALLSDRYRPMENEDLASAVLPVLGDAKLDIISCEVTDRRLYIKACDRSLSRELARHGAALGDGGHTIVRVPSFPAITISNSEVGCGALSVLAGVYDSGCSNLATFGERSMRKYHTGARHELASDDTYAMLSDETRAKTDQALWLQVRDVVKAAFDRARFDALIDKIQATQSDKIGGAAAPAVVETVVKRFGFNSDEGKNILQHLIEGGELSRFGLANAITRASTDVADYDRATELERVGGQLIELPRTEWQALALAA